MDKDLALQPVPIRTHARSRHLRRAWQGIPGIARSPTGELWVSFYSGGADEGPDNFVVVLRSVDDGANWSGPIAIVDPPDQVRAFDPCVWFDPSGRLWLFWAQSYGWFDGRCGVWSSVCPDVAGAPGVWTPPERLADGVMMNKPTVLRSGTWLLPTAVWASRSSPLNDLSAVAYSAITSTTDRGASFELRGWATVPGRYFDEHMVVERQDGSLWMLVRCDYGIGESFSTDEGHTWSVGRPSSLTGPNSRFFIRRLASGRLLLINHHAFTGRNNLTAMLSEDDGATWQGHLMLDSRGSVSYPDADQSADGRIWIVHDHDRQGLGEILLDVVTEEDVLAGRLVAPDSRLGVVITDLQGG